MCEVRERLEHSIAGVGRRRLHTAQRGSLLVLRNVGVAERRYQQRPALPWFVAVVIAVFVVVAVIVAVVVVVAVSVLVIFLFLCYCRCFNLSSLLS